MAEQLKALISKFGEIWGQIGLNQRISIILAGGAVLAGLVTLGVLTSKSPDVTLVSGISDAEAANITAALDDEKIPYELAGRENSITVPKSIYHKARMKLALKGIPETGDKGYKVFDEPSFGRSDYVQRLQHQVALQQELEMTIKEFEDVDAVRVHIVPPKRTLLVDPTTLPKASVWIKKAKIKISPSSIDAIQNLVAHAVEGLEPSNVTVVDEEGTLLSKAAGDDSIESNAEGHLKARKDHEQYLSDKVQGMLDRVLGTGKSIVKVNVSMTTDAVQQVSRMYNPTNQVILNSTTQEQYEVSSSPEGGVPGTTTNSPQSTNSFALPPGYTSMTNVIKDIQFGNEELTTTTTKMPGSMTNISASVIIDTQYQTDTNGIVVSVMRPQAEIDNLKVAVMNALAIQNSNTISLIQLPFENSDQTSMLTHIKKMDQQMFYYELIKQILYLGLPVMFFLGFVRMWKKSSIDAIPIGVPVGEIESTMAQANPTDASGEGANVPADQPEGTASSESGSQLDTTDDETDGSEANQSQDRKENPTQPEKEYELEIPFSEEELMAGLSDNERQELQFKIRKINQWIHEKPETVVRTVKNWLEQEDEKPVEEEDED